MDFNNEIYIKELDFNILRPTILDIQQKKESEGFKLIVIGKPRSGKSWLIRDLLYHKRNLIPSGIVFSGTEDSNSFYSSFIPGSFVYDGLDVEKIKDFVKRQKISIQYVDNPWSLLLIDDCTDDPKILSTPLFQKLYKNGRHWQIFFILSLQYALDIKPAIRNNIDGVFIFRDANLENRQRVYRNYAGIIPSFDLFQTIMDQITDNYTALYIHNTSISNNWQDCVFWYRAEERETFQFGCPEYWNFHFERFNKNYVRTFDI